MLVPIHVIMACYRLHLDIDRYCRLPVSGRRFWSGVTKVDYRSSIVGNIFVVTGSDDSTYAQHLKQEEWTQ
jgi:hypothetical protein